MKTLAAAGALMIALAMPMAAAEDNSPSGGSTQTPSQGADSNQQSTNGSNGQHRATSPGNPDVAAPSDSTDKQPPVATGSDLNGSAKAFPSNKAPE